MNQTSRFALMCLNACATGFAVTAVLVASAAGSAASEKGARPAAHRPAHEIAASWRTRVQVAPRSAVPLMKTNASFAPPSRLSAPTATSALPPVKILVPYPEGVASYYWQPQKTASGEHFDKMALTAAHRTLPFNTRVRVTHVANGRSVVVRINDRGPFKPGRIIDLSDAAAGLIGMKSQGLAHVRLEVLSAESPP